MKDLQTAQRELIDQWLRIATKDLCVSAKERITLEIETHFQEAVDAHVANSEPLYDA